jgi:hypothetical protein
MRALLALTASPSALASSYLAFSSSLLSSITWGGAGVCGGGGRGSAWVVCVGGRGGTHQRAGASNTNGGATSHIDKLQAGDGWDM